MYTIYICSVGKTKEDWLNEALALYQKRLLHRIKIHYIWVKDNEQLLNRAQKDPFVITLDPRGEMYTSEGFSSYLFRSFEKSSSLTFIIGGPLGLPEEFSKYPGISLSKMIFTHQMTRLILTEQIYRADEISKNSPYHFSSAKAPRFSAKA